MSIVVRKGKVVGVYVFYDDDEDRVVGRYFLTDLQQQQMQMNNQIAQLDIVNRPYRLQTWAQQFYPVSPDGQFLAQIQKRKAEIDDLISKILASGL